MHEYLLSFSWALGIRHANATSPASRAESNAGWHNPYRLRSGQNAFEFKASIAWLRRVGCRRWKPVCAFSPESRPF
jgi:hypothetical protein